MEEPKVVVVSEDGTFFGRILYGWQGSYRWFKLFATDCWATDEWVLLDTGPWDEFTRDRVQSALGTQYIDPVDTCSGSETKIHMSHLMTRVEELVEKLLNLHRELGAVKP